MTSTERDMTEYWFKPATWGYGAEPANWKGWAALLAFAIALVALFAVVMLFIDGEASRSEAAWASAVIGIAIYAFLEFVRRRTHGGWIIRWTEDYFVLPIWF